MPIIFLRPNSTSTGDWVSSPVVADNLHWQHVDNDVDTLDGQSSTDPKIVIQEEISSFDRYGFTSVPTNLDEVTVITVRTAGTLFLLLVMVVA